MYLSFFFESFLEVLEALFNIGSIYLKKKQKFRACFPVRFKNNFLFLKTKNYFLKFLTQFDCYFLKIK